MRAWGLAPAAWLALAWCASAGAQQIADPHFDMRVAHPAYVSRHPRLVIDEAHHEFHTASGRYKPFAELARHDGYAVAAGTRPLTHGSLAGIDVLVIANALGTDDMADPAAANPAFSARECDAVHQWVRRGGALLLIADHAPMGAAARTLAARFGVELTNGCTVDTVREDPSDGSTQLLFGRGRGLVDHAITRGRTARERVNLVKTFTGESLRGRAGSVPLLVLSDRAEDLMVNLWELDHVRPDQRHSAAGRLQGLTLTPGRGRVVVLGEAAMMSAQLAGPDSIPMGMNAPGIDNRQLALNILHWLSGALQ